VRHRANCPKNVILLDWYEWEVIDVSTMGECQRCGGKARRVTKTSWVCDSCDIAWDIKGEWLDTPLYICPECTGKVIRDSRKASVYECKG